MEFARFATIYSVTLAALGAAFSLCVVPFLEVHWAHWITAGIIQLLVAGSIVFVRLASNPDDAPGALNTAHGVAVVVLPLLALVALSIAPLFQWPMIAWLLPGGVLAFAGMVAAFAAIYDDAAHDAGVSFTRLDNDYNGRCDVPDCSEWSMYRVKFPTKQSRSVEFELCFGNYMEFRVESESGNINTLEDVKLWMNRSGPWIHWREPDKINEFRKSALARFARHLASASTRGGA